MSKLTDALERIIAERCKHMPVEYKILNPGLSTEQLREKLKRFPRQLPKEIHALYQWHNGTDDDAWEHGIFVYHSFLDIDNALQQAKEYINDERARSYRETQCMPSYLFPFCDFQGEYFAVAGREAATESTPIFFIDTLGEVRVAFNSLTNMMVALAECYESGVYGFVDGDYFDVLDEAKFGEIRLKHNPEAVAILYAGGW